MNGLVCKTIKRAKWVLFQKELMKIAITEKVPPALQLIEDNMTGDYYVDEVRSNTELSQSSVMILIKVKKGKIRE